MNKLKIAYFGSPDFSAQFLEKLIKNKDIPIEVKVVITQPDKKVGRKQILTPSPVKQVALQYGLSIIDNLEFKIQSSELKTPKNKILNSKLNSQLYILNYKLLQNIDLAILYAYGNIISSALLKIPKYGFWNIHPSLLPKYRGPSPIAYPLILGEAETGVTLMQMDERIDHGPIIAQEKVTIPEKEKRPDLEKRLTDVGFEMLKNYLVSHSGLSRIQSQKRDSGVTADERIPRMTEKNQDHSQATFTRLLTKQDGFIPFSTIKKAIINEPLTNEEIPGIIKEYLYKNSNYKLQITNYKNIRNSAKIIYNYFRGLFPWPGIWTTINVKGAEKRLKITNVEFKDNKLDIRKVQLEGKKEVEFKTFNSYYNLF